MTTATCNLFLRLVSNDLDGKMNAATSVGSLPMVLTLEVAALVAVGAKDLVVVALPSALPAALHAVATLLLAFSLWASKANAS